MSKNHTTQILHMADCYSAIDGDGNPIVVLELDSGFHHALTLEKARQLSNMLRDSATGAAGLCALKKMLVDAGETPEAVSSTLEQYAAYYRAFDVETEAVE